MTAPSIKEALERRVALALMQVKARPPACERECFVLSPDPDFDDLPANGDEGTADDEVTQEAVLRLARAALATLQPSGERREAIRNLVRDTAMSLPPSDFGSHRAIEAMTDAILASGLVQDDPTTSKKEVVGGERREAIAKELWHRFSPPHHIDWESEPHKGEYLKCADEIISLLRLGWFGSGLVQDEAGHVLAPLEPTPEMISAAWTIINAEKRKVGVARLGAGLGVSEIYRAMITAIRSARDGGAES